MKTLVAALALAVLPAFSSVAAESATNFIDGVAYVCEDGVCRMVGGEDADSEQAAGLRIPAEALPEPAAVAQGYMDEDAFVAFLEDRVPQSGESDRSLWVAFLLAILGGLALNLTPCVLPMVPVNLIVIGRSVARGAWYALGILVAYGGLGLMAALGGASFGAIQSSPWFSMAVAVLLAAMSLAMFGFFRVDFSRFRAGLRGGAFFLGVVSALLAGACVAPVLVTTLILTARLFAAGSYASLLLPFALGLGFALPWPFLAAGLGVLPKPGSWMRWVNRAFAVAVMALAVRYGLVAWRTAAGGGAPADAASKAVEVAEPAALSLEGLPRPVLVDCWAPWCGSCAAMDRMISGSERVRGALKGFTLVRLRSDRVAELRSLPGLGDVRGLPTFIIYR